MAKSTGKSKKSDKSILEEAVKKSSAKRTSSRKQATSAYISNPFTVFAKSFRAVLEHNFSVLLIFLAVGIFSLSLGFLLAVAGLSNFQLEFSAVWLLLLIAIGLVWAIILMAGFTKYSLMTAQGQPITFTESLRVGYQKASGYLATVLLVSVIVLGGLVLLIIPGLIFLYWFLLAPYVYIDQEVGVVEALKRSKKLVTKQPAEVFGMFGAGTIFSLPAFIPVIGFVYQFFYQATWYVAWAYRYQSAQKLKNRNKPATDPANYWAIGLALVVSILIGVLFAAAFESGFKIEINTNY